MPHSASTFLFFFKMYSKWAKIFKTMSMWRSFKYYKIIRSIQMQKNELQLWNLAPPEVLYLWIPAMEVKVFVCVGGLNLNFELCRFLVGIFGEEKSGVRLLFWTFDFTPSPACWINQAQPIFNWITFLFSLRKDPLHCQLDWCVRFLKICQDLSRSWIQMLDLAPSKPPLNW